MQTDPLDEWNRLENKNTIGKLVSVAYEQVLARAPDLERFITWLLVGTGATAALVIANSESIVSIITREAFETSLYFLIVSAIFGLLAKCVYAFFPMSSSDKLREELGTIIDAHRAERMKIEESAKVRGAPAPPDLSLKDFMDEYARLLPAWGKWMLFLALRRQEKYSRGVRRYVVPVRAFSVMSLLSLLQAVSFLVFVLTVAIAL